MGIISITTDFAGQDNVRPGNIRMLTTDSYDKVIAPGYLNNTTLNSPIKSTDVISVIYNYSEQTGNGIYSIFIPVITGNVITLTPSQEGALLPVVDGHIAQFNGAGGQIKDGGPLGTAASKAASDPTKSSVASIASGSAGKVATFADNNGTIAYDNRFFRAAVFTLVSGQTSQSITDPALNVGGVLVANIATSANPSSVLKAVAGTGSATIILSADPGVGTLNYIFTKIN